MKFFGMLTVGVAGFGLLAGTAAAAINGPYEVTGGALLCYKGKVDKDIGNAAFGVKGTIAELADSDTTDGTRDFSESGVKGVCLAANVNSNGFVAQTINGIQHKMKADKEDAKHDPFTTTVYNELGSISVSTSKLDRFISLATRGGAQSIVPPVFANHLSDAYKCFKIKANEKFPKGVQATVVDALTDATFDVKKPKLLCVGVGVDGSGVHNSLNDLLCYQAKPVKGTPKHVANEAFYSDFMVNKGGNTNPYIGTKKEEMLCLPSLVPPTAEFCGNDAIDAIDTDETCDGTAGCTLPEICAEGCDECTLCGNGLIDGLETCEVDTDCTEFEECTACACTPRAALGPRTMTLGSPSAFYSSVLSDSVIGTVKGSLAILGAAMSNLTNSAALSSSGTSYVSIDVPLGAPQRICYEVTNCTGEIFCNGGENTDVNETLDSLAVANAPCVQDGSNSCPNDPSSECCSNSCEGVNVGSGNAGVLATQVNPGDSGEGAAYMVCDTRVLQGLPIYTTDCSAQVYGGSPIPRALSTTRSGTTVEQHCAGTAPGPAANVVLSFPKTADTLYTNGGENFDCSDFSSTDSEGSFLMGIPAEQPSPFLSGDASNGLVLND